MARLPARVGWITHKRMDTKVALRLDKDTMTFQAKWADKTYYNKDGATLRERILKLIEASEHLEFCPVIEVELAQQGSRSGRGRGVDITMRLNRFYYADGDDGFLSVAWEDRDNKHRIRRWNPGDDFTGLPHHRPRRYSYGPDRYYLAYTGDLWAGFTVLLDTIEQARAKVAQLLDSDDMVSRLETVGAELMKALPAPKEEM